MLETRTLYNVDLGEKPQVVEISGAVHGGLLHNQVVIFVTYISNTW